MLKYSEHTNQLYKYWYSINSPESKDRLPDLHYNISSHVSIWSHKKKKERKCINDAITGKKSELLNLITADSVLLFMCYKGPLTL